MSVLLVKSPCGRDAREAANGTALGRANLELGLEHGHPASDQILDPAAKAAWPYALLCAWTYLNDRDSAHDLMDHAMRNARGYFCAPSRQRRTEAHCSNQKCHYGVAPSRCA